MATPPNIARHLPTLLGAKRAGAVRGRGRGQAAGRRAGARARAGGISSGPKVVAMGDVYIAQGGVSLRSVTKRACKAQQAGKRRTKRRRRDDASSSDTDDSSSSGASASEGPASSGRGAEDDSEYIG